MENDETKSRFFLNQQGKSARLTFNESLVNNHEESKEIRVKRYSIYKILLDNNLFFKSESEEETDDEEEQEIIQVAKLNIKIFLHFFFVKEIYY